MLLVVVTAGCGRFGFGVLSGDAVGSGDGLGGDGMLGDGMLGDGAPAVSCQTLAPTCGPTGTSPCCESPTVTGGTYARSYDVSGDGMYPDSSYTATVSTFRLDRYEVTVGRFRQFVLSGAGTAASPPIVGAGARTLNGMANQGGWDASWNGSLTNTTAKLTMGLQCNATYQTWTDTPGANESLPITCTTWFEAMAFCAWDGGFLPTEAEWNYAAAGGNEQRGYPWSSPPAFLGTPDCSYANYLDGTYCVNPPNGLVNRVGSESPQGDGKWGQSDLGGNAFEWTLDWYASPYPQNPCIDCANLTTAANRVIRGGSFFYDATSLRAGPRNNVAPAVRYRDVSLRCARTP